MTHYACHSYYREDGIDVRIVSCLLPRCGMNYQVARAYRDHVKVASQDGQHRYYRSDPREMTRAALTLKSVCSL